jgi:hypothetical protein
MATAEKIPLIMRYPDDVRRNESRQEYVERMLFRGMTRSTLAIALVNWAERRWKEGSALGRQLQELDDEIANLESALERAIREREAVSFALERKMRLRMMHREGTDPGFVIESLEPTSADLRLTQEKWRARKEVQRRNPWTRRNRMMAVLYLNDGLTTREIADQFDLTRARVQQILKSLGIDGHMAAVRREEREAAREARERLNNPECQICLRHLPTGRTKTCSKTCSDLRDVLLYHLDPECGGTPDRDGRGVERAFVLMEGRRGIVP